MRSLPSTRPSASMVVSILALVVALSGSAVAASNLVSGDKLIKKHSLSGNRLRNHTITGAQVNMARLGKVRSAANADHATNATNSANAGIAGSANTLGGKPASAFESSANWVRSGLVTAAGGQTAPVANFGPFTLTLKCTDNGGGNFTSTLQASSSEANSEALGNILTPGTPTNLFGASGAAFNENGDTAIDFITASGKTYQGDGTAGVHMPGSAKPCFANALVGKS